MKTYLTTKNEIVLLTSMRGLAALFVVFYHLYIYLPKLRPGLVLFSRAYLWVDFFFILSGFIISYVYRESILNKKKYKEFFLARFARLYPLHLFTFLILVGLESMRFFVSSQSAPFSSSNNNLFAILTNLLMIHSLGIHKYLTWNLPSWSISTEWAAYCCFPFLCLLTKKWKITEYIVASILIFTMIVLLNRYFGNLDLTYDYGFFRCILEFALGMILYVLYKISSINVVFRNPLILSLLLMISLFFIFLPGRSDLDFAVIISFTFLVLSLATYDKGVFFKILGNKPLKFLGDISYSVYLNHVVLFYLIYEFLKVVSGKHDFNNDLSIIGSITYAVLYCSLLIITSYFTYSKIEMPARIYIKKLLQPKTGHISKSIKPEFENLPK